MRATGTLRFVVPPGFVVHANGARRESADEAARGVFRFEVERPTFFSFGAGRYTVARRANPVTAVAYVTLDEGVTMFTNLVDCDFDALKIGQPVKVAFRKGDDG